MIDLHCHILPGLDDGAADMAAAVQMARIAVADGITTVVATPHLGEPPLPPAVISARLGLLRDELARQQVSLEVVFGADVPILAALDDFSGYSINRAGYLLVEFPHSFIPRNAGELLFRLRAAGLQPILTHPERNAAVLNNPAPLLALAREHVLLQVTADSLAGNFGPAARDCSIFLLEEGVVDFIASDGHGIASRRPVLSGGLEAAARVIGRDRARRLVADNPAAVLAGEKVRRETLDVRWKK